LKTGEDERTVSQRDGRWKLGFLFEVRRDDEWREGLFSARSTAKQVTQHKTRYDPTPNSQSRPRSALPVNLSELWYFIVKCPPLILNGSRIYVVLVKTTQKMEGKIAIIYKTNHNFVMSFCCVFDLWDLFVMFVF
jgi:hypothetical protein